MTGEFSHLMEKTTHSAAMIYAACQKESFICAGVSFFLNIFSMRSVIRNPATMLMVANITAMFPAPCSTWAQSPLPRDQNRADHGNRRDRVGQRHQRRVQQGRNAAHQFQAQRDRQHQHVRLISISLLIVILR